MFETPVVVNVGGTGSFLQPLIKNIARIKPERIDKECAFFILNLITKKLKKSYAYSYKKNIE
jgi:hypothetical protein